MNPLAKLNKQYIGGVWRDGSSTKILSDRNPYNGDLIAEFRLGTLSDLNPPSNLARACVLVVFPERHR
jgi:hypothetical protein